MSTEEFSDSFDVLLNSYNNVYLFGLENKQGISCDEYEKSVFLTKAQEEIVIELYNGKNQYKEGFEKTEELRRYLSNLVKQVTLAPKEVEEKSALFQLPSDVLFITNELVILEDEALGCLNGDYVGVVPARRDELIKLLNNPFRGPTNKRVLRLDKDNNGIELVSKYRIKEYILTYLAKPSPIILTDLGDLSIDNIQDVTECVLHSALHRTILERAVQLAFSSKAQPTNNNNKD